METALKAEIDANFDYFQRNLKSLLEQALGRYALLRHQHAVEFFDRPEQADAAGQSRYPDQLFSIQQIVSEAVELGLYSDAAH